jgi:pimeloyl-CoA synthetase
MKKAYTIIRNKVSLDGTMVLQVQEGERGRK